jgi:heme-degrading monooxygenase HmoA
MPTLPWAAVTSLDPEREYVVMATRFLVTSRRHIPQIVRSTQALWDALPKTDGLLGYSLKSSISRRTLSTLTAWTDRDALTAFVQSEPHVLTARRTNQWMTDSHFASWTAASFDLPPTWPMALTRLDSQ